MVGREDEAEAREGWCEVIARAVGTMGECEAQLAATRVQIDAVMQRYHDECAEAHRLRATIERHEARAAQHAEERAALHAEMARVTGERDAVRGELAEARAQIAAHETDLADAAGKLLVPIPMPGTETAKLLRANVLLRRERDDAAQAQQADFDSLYADYVARGEAIDTLSRERDDDARYIVRRHSRRAPARVGLGEIVWCDGGIARTGGDRG